LCWAAWLTPAPAAALDASLQLLKKQHLSDVLEVAELRDGVVAFEHAADADRFAGKLEEEGHSQVRGEACAQALL
jgi:hypothetical protein